MVLDKLTIDGVDMKIHDVVQYRGSASKAITSANTWTELCSVDLPANGIFLIYGYYSFNIASSTGATTRGLEFQTVNEGGSTMTPAQVLFHDANANGAPKTIFRYFNTEETARTFKLRAYSSKTCSASSATLYALKIIDTKVGGGNP